MRKLVSISVGIIALAVIVFLLAPFVTGALIQKKYPDLLAQFSRVSGANIQIQRYHRGWFKSTAQLEMTIPSAPPILIHQKIVHGPFAFVSTNSGQKTLYFALAVIKEAAQSQGTALNTISVWRFNNDLKMMAKTDQFNIQTAMGNFALSNLNSAIYFTPETQHFSGDFSLAHFVSVSQAAAMPSIDLKDLQIHSNNSGKVTLSLGDLTAISINKKSTEIQNAAFLFQQTETKNTTDMTTTFDAKVFNTPEDSLSNLHFSLSINHLSTAAVQQYWQQMQAAQMTSQANFGLSFVQLYGLMQVVDKGLSIELNALNAQTKDGAIQLQGGITIPAQSTQTSSIAATLAHITGHATISLPYQFVLNQWALHYAQDQKLSPTDALAERIKSGEFIQQGNQLTMQIDLKNATILVNGKPLSAYTH